MSYLNQFLNHIENNDYSAFLTLWEEYCMGDEADPEELKQVLEKVKTSDLASPFGRHIEQILPLWNKLSESPLKGNIIKLIFDLQTINSKELAEFAIRYLQEKFGDAKYFMEKLKLVGLRDQQNFQGAISNFVLLNHMQVGNFVFHTAGWGVGEIMEVSFLREQLALEFDFVAGKKDLSFQNAFNTLIPLSKEHFLARRFGNPDELEQLAKKDPIEVLHMILQDLGPISAAELKDELCELVIPANEWQKWWQTARAKAKKDPQIETPSDTKSPFRLLDTKVSHEERLLEALAKKPGANTLIHLIHSFLRDFPSATKDEAFRENLKNYLKEALSSQELSDAQELQLQFFIEEFSLEGSNSAVEELIKRLISLDAIIQEIDIIAFKKKVLKKTRELREDWADIFLNLLLNLESNPLRDYALNELLDAKLEKPVIEKLEELLHNPIKSPSVFLWYIQKIMKSTKLPFANQEGKIRFLESLLILLSELEKSSESREQIKKIHNFLTTGRYANIRKIIQHASEAQVHEFLLLATKCHSLTSHDIKIFHSLAEVVHPNLGNLRKKYEDDQDKQEVIWTTNVGYQHLKNRIHQIANVDILDNAKEIETARGHGDLRENAEYKAALERRDRLQSELKQLSKQFNQAQVLSPEDVNTSQVGVGTIVYCKDQEGKEQSFTILGPWDANPEKYILSFQSKLAQDLTGKKVGDSITIQGKNYTIEGIESYFAVAN